MKKIFTLAAAALVSSTAFAAITSAPESAEVQTWYFNAEVFYPTEQIINQEVQVAKDGNDIYIKGIYTEYSDIDNWVKGTLENGVYAFETRQDLGVLWGSYKMSFAGYDGDNVVLATATMQDDVLTFSTGIAILYTEYTSSSPAIWWKAGATISAEPVEYVEPSLTEQTATLPYRNNFDSESKRNQVAIYSPDGLGWDWGADWDTNNWYATCNNDGYTQANDYLIFPGVTFEAGQQYVVSFDAKSTSPSHWQNFEVVMAPEAKLSQFTEKVLDGGLCYSTEWQTFEKEFTVAEEGTYFLAIHCTSYAYNGYFSVDNFAINTVDMDMPEVAKDFSVTPGRNGALNATLSFNLPTTNIAGVAYESDKVLAYTVTRGEIVVAEGSDKAGALVVAADRGEGLTNGIAVYNVVVKDENHVSKPASANAYIGVDETTDTEYVEITADGNMVTIAWVPVTRGAHGGYVGAKYNVYACYALGQRGEKLNAEPLTECSYTFEYEIESGEQRDAWFCVTTVNEIDESHGAYASIPAGAPYELPFTEGFARNSTHKWTFEGENGGDAYIDYYGTFATDGDKSSLCMYAMRLNDETLASATSGLIYVAKGAKLTFDYKTECPLSMAVSVVANGEVIPVLEPCALETGEGSMELEDIFANVQGTTAQLRFVGSNFSDYYSGLYIDNILIEVVDVPTAISELNAESAAKVYNLNGQLIARPAAGLYIQNGQKFMVK